LRSVGLKRCRPLNLTSLPRAAEISAWAPQLTYNAQEVKSVVDFAYRRGIRVIPELDMPAGHFSSFVRGYPELAAGPTISGVFSQNLDPTNPEVFSALRKLFAELADLFPSREIHVGFDEVDLNGWNTTKIDAWMAHHNMTQLKDVESFFLDTIRELAKDVGFKTTIWDDPVGEGVTVPADVTLQVWGGGPDKVSSLCKQGYNVVYSSPFYLDHLDNGWDTIYSNTDLETPFTHFLGAEACMWGESVDKTNAVPRVWPRAAALAEILWSPGYDSYPRIPARNQDRLARWRCGVTGRGVAAEPVQAGFCPSDVE